MHTKARFSTEEFRIYSQGYYFGVVYSLRVAEEAIHRFDVHRQTMRAAARAKRSA